MKINFPREWGPNHKGAILVTFDLLDGFIDACCEAGYQVYSGLHNYAKGCDIWCYMYDGVVHASRFNYDLQEPVYHIEDLIETTSSNYTDILQLL